MIYLSKYQYNMSSEPVKIKASPFGNLDRTCCHNEEAFRKNEIRKRINLYLLTGSQDMGSRIYKLQLLNLPLPRQLNLTRVTCWAISILFDFVNSLIFTFNFQFCCGIVKQYNK